jgi:putative transposase
MTQRAYRYRFYPTAEQENLLRRTLGCTRLVYNRALSARTEGWYERQERIGYKETSALLTEWKQEDEKKRNGGSAAFTKSAFRWKDGELFLAKCSEALPIRWSRQLPQGAELSTVTVKLEPSGRWFVGLLVETERLQ